MKEIYEKRNSIKSIRVYDEESTRYEWVDAKECIFGKNIKEGFYLNGNPKAYRYSAEELVNGGHIIKDDGVYLAANIDVFLEKGECLTVYFNTYREASEAAHNLYVQLNDFVHIKAD